jgi:hypothetical protein
MKIILYFLILSLLFGCNNQSKLDLVVFPRIQKREVSELEKLQRRREKWLIAQKCLEAKIISSDKTLELCSNSQDVYQLSEGAGWSYAKSVVDFQLEVLDAYEKDLEKGIREKLPPDSLLTTKADNERIHNDYDNSLYAIERKRDESKLCAIKSQLGEVNYQECKSSIDNKYKVDESELQEKHKNIDVAIQAFKNNYIPLE